MVLIALIALLDQPRLKDHQNVLYVEQINMLMNTADNVKIVELLSIQALTKRSALLALQVTFVPRLALSTFVPLVITERRLKMLAHVQNVPLEVIARLESNKSLVKLVIILKPVLKSVYPVQVDMPVVQLL